MQLTVNGQVYEFEAESLTNSEAMALEKQCGMTFQQWNDMLTAGSVGALTGLVWVVLRRTTPDLAFDDVKFDLSAIELKDDEAVPTVEPDSSDDRRLRYLADFANIYGIRPWEWELLTVADTEILCAGIDELREKNSG